MLYVCVCVLFSMNLVVDNRSPIHCLPPPHSPTPTLTHPPTPSVIGQQVMSIQMAIRAKEPRMNFEGSDIVVSDRFSVFITMNPGYAGRSALPDSLSALFRPVAMMVR